ncbi:MAG: hypothetical protein ABUM51_01385 [Bacteroidota bacterium]
MAETALPTNNLGLEKRKDILGIALTIEGLTSGFIAALLGIEDPENSRTLGNKSSALTFNQKIDLLIDLGAMSDETRSKYSTFMEIRSQFMHNIEASTYEKCYDFLQGKEAYIFKKYPQKGFCSREEALEKASLELANDVLNITLELIEGLKEKATEASTYNRQSSEAFQRTIPQIKEKLNKIIENFSGQGKDFKIEQLMDLGTIVGTTIYSLWNRNLEEIINEDKRKR